VLILFRHWRVLSPLATPLHCLLLWLAFAVTGVRAAETPEPPARAVTTLAGWWEAAQEKAPQPIAFDAVVDVTFIDPTWKNMWVLQDGTGSYVALAKRAVKLKPGQRVRFKGTFTPTTRLSTDDFEIFVLEERPTPAPVSTAGDFINYDRYQHRFVKVEGVVESQESADQEHNRFHLLTEGHRAEVIVLVKPTDAIPLLPGARVIVEGVYVPAYDSAGNRTHVVLWVSRFDAVRTAGWLTDDPRATQPPTSIAELSSKETGTWVRLIGTVAASEPGRFLQISDGNSVKVLTAQTILPKVGEKADLFGRVRKLGEQVEVTEAIVPPNIMSAAKPRSAPTVLNRLAQWWELTSSGSREAAQLDATAVVAFFDPAWHNLWLIENGVGYYAELGKGQRNFRVGDRLSLKGTVVPGSNISTDTLEIAVLEQNALPESPAIDDSIKDHQRWRNLRVKFSGWVESQEKLDDHHLRLSVIARGLRIEVNVNLSAHDVIPNLTGSRIQLEGVYAPRDSLAGALNRVTLWVQSLDDVRQLGALEDDPRFRAPVATPEALRTARAGDWVHVIAKVQDHNPGSVLDVNVGELEVSIRSLQQTPASPGDTIRAVGRVVQEVGRIILSDALYFVQERAGAAIATAPVRDLTSAAQVIALSPSQAEAGMPVRLTGVVVWSHPSSRHIYLLDATRAARVRLPEGTAVPAIGRGASVRGTTAPGQYAPEVSATVVSDSGALQYMEIPEPRTSSLEQAMTGVEEAQWIELSGYVRAVARDGIWTRLSVLTSGGEFVAWVPHDDLLDRTIRAVVRIRGICTAVTNDRRQLTGVQLWVPSSAAVQIEEAAPAEPFALPLQSLASLQQFNVLQSNNRLVRIAATLVHHQPGRILFAEDNGEAIRVLSSSKAPLSPGDRIEIVGLPGRENSQLVVREAVFRKVGSGKQPPTTLIAPPDLLQEALDGRLAQLEATLLGLVKRGHDTRLLLQAGSVSFDAVLPDHSAEASWPAGSVLQVTGVYELIRDEYRRPYAFQLQLRNVSDIAILKAPSWLTPARALGAVGVLAAALTAGLLWVRSLRQRVQAQTHEISCQLAKVAHLEARHRGIIENASDFILTADLEGRITSFNPAGERITGYPVAAALSLRVRDLIAPEDLSAGVPILDLAAQPNGTATFRCRFQKSDATRVWVEISARLLTENGKPAGILAVVRDFSERHKYEEALESARDAAEANARAKSTFLANMSHEIRTPMNGVIGMSNLLLDTDLDSQQRDFAETIRSSAESLLTVLNDILDFSKIEAGKLQFETLDFDLTETVESTLELLAARAAGKGLELASFVQSEVPSWVRGDSGRLRQVLLNLVGNAIKFTAKGEVVVRVSVDQQNQRDAQVRFEVSDTGIGLSREAQAALFQPFVQADSSTTRKYGGTGLGLAICKQIVELMGGQIGIESQLGVGSTFWFTVPFLKSAPPEPTDGSRPIDTASLLANLRVAVVDDNGTNRSLLHHYLQSWGAITELFSNGPEALAALRKAAAAGSPFQVALLDFHMPEMTGLTLAEKIKADRALSGTYCLLLTSLDHRFDRAQLDASGIAQMMTKPIRKNELRTAIRTAVLNTGEAAVPAKRIRAASAPAASPGWRVLIAEDNVVNQRVARLQLEKLGHRVDLVANGLEAIEALQRAPYDVVLMDCQMPELDGYEATRRIRRESPQAEIQIVAMTAHAMEGDREVCLEAGMNDYVSKPMRIQELAAVFERLDAAIKARRKNRDTDVPFRPVGVA
jgi:two-component system, sensor histidine kinase and response regulator